MCPVLIGSSIISCACILLCACAVFIMQCLNPVMMWKSSINPKTGKVVYSCKPPSSWVAHGSDCDLFAPCGKCFACKFNRRLEWQHRLESELWTNPVASFVTLTYNDDCLPGIRPVPKSDIQKFIKRFRHLQRDFGIALNSFKYFFVIEYGSKTKRPHYHGVIFGSDFLSKRFLPEVVSYASGHPLYSSSVLAHIWKKGFVSVDRVTPAVFAYVTKYVLKTLDDSDLWFVYSRNIGSDAFFSDGKLTSLCHQSFENGKLFFGNSFSPYPSPPPKFVYRRLEKLDPDLYASVKASRHDFLVKAKLDNRSPSDRSVFHSMRENNKERLLDNAS